MKNNVIWITGASSGIGAELAKQYAKEGALLILSARREKVLQEVKSSCEHQENITVLPLDLKDFNSMPQYVEKALAVYGSIDLLINNGGVSQRSLIADTKIEVYQELMDINYVGTVALTKALLPYFIERKKGHFAVVTSVMGKFGSPFRSGYCGAKHALHGFFDVLRMEHQKDNVDVTLICPGFVQTNVTINALTGTGARLNHDDPGTKNGLEVAFFCRKMIRAIRNKKWEVSFGKKEKLGVFVKRFSQKLLHAIVMRSNVR
ncbi:MAG: SDR family oxidoreductase [Flavobacteriaceae bacterium]|nr:SDR family oxidoreductase [Flavobacteriaceae bacterium]MDG1090709.1 SDR family oxidoreductase [Flavobacteriaceae bacterium]